jgi:hypothetical protein
MRMFRDKSKDGTRSRPIILATWEVEVGRIRIPGQPKGKKICEIPSQ